MAWIGQFHLDYGKHPEQRYMPTFSITVIVELSLARLPPETAMFHEPHNIRSLTSGSRLTLQWVTAVITVPTMSHFHLAVQITFTCCGEASFLQKGHSEMARLCADVSQKHRFLISSNMSSVIPSVGICLLRDGIFTSTIPALTERVNDVLPVESSTYLQEIN